MCIHSKQFMYSLEIHSTENSIKLTESTIRSFEPVVTELLDNKGLLLYHLINSLVFSV